MEHACCSDGNGSGASGNGLGHRVDGGSGNQDEIATVVGCEYHQDTYGTYPPTGEPVYPPYVIVATCSERARGWVKSSIVRLNESRGWSGDYFERPLYEEKSDGRQD
ncbi:MAG: hypothetical protein IKF14_13865 [Atopobiaceae bacterium]|nr:hypothetical protein [Atopobiaceae bacterium]MBR3160166.1 hypothetical protein [Atopobiaceae bacterium]